ncbi:major facilitator superfamily domain-containing protein [Gilbertella persicaria]|uniref:major facilitator superfamily domain-containing protein n=1 Tax=Gilbertella persicaria TaxID=101096 RepID=UPI00221FFE17|nr:major facilitator superfamily domain-containing protein [Gilbertella persicaria]KAI8072145.1 major facilitator superfamily domain-containing protein [Gilbertella persicaria]
MDRTNISNAISDNLPADLGFNMTGVNTGTLVHSIVFTVITLVTQPVVKRVGAHIWIPILMFSWAIDFNGFIAVRFFIAFTEAGFIPACLYYLQAWYKTNELATRLSWFWALQSFASAFSGLISFGIFRLAGVGGLYGWKWLFIIDGILTHVVGFISIFYIPSSPFYTSGQLRGKGGWFTERQSQIAVTRIVRDDLTKADQKSRISWHDIKISLLDTRLWTHLVICFASMMPTTPVGTYLPTLIKGYGFSVTTSNLLTVPSFIIGLIASVIIAHDADKRGWYGFHALIGPFWSIAGFIALEFLKDDAGPWNFYAAALFLASSPSWHGMHIAWMSSNLAPLGKRTLALGVIVGSANIAGVPASQIYQQDDSPRFFRGNWINFGICVSTVLLVLFQHTRYVLTNNYREKKWNSMSDSEKKEYLKNTKDEGSNRLDFRFRL